MNKIYLISPTTLKSDYRIDKDIEDKYLISAIQKMQDLYIEVIFDKDYWKDLLNQVDTDTVTDLNDELITKYIRPLLASYIESEVFFNSEFKIKNIGTESTNTDINVVDNYMNRNKELANTYQKRLERFMIDNSIPFGCYYNGFQTSFFIPDFKIKKYYLK